VANWFAPEILEKFSQPDAYPTDPSAERGVSWIQTHLSHVFLTERRVYKLRKSVDLGFVDFTTREERNADCVREISLNRRLAPDVYLGVAPLLTDGHACWAGPISEASSFGDSAPEHFVVMRRLRDGRDALSLLEKGVLSELQIDRVARRIANFHERNQLGAPAPFAAAVWQARCVDPVEECFRTLFAVSEDGGVRALLAETADLMRDFAKRHVQRFEERRLSGRAVDSAKNSGRSTLRQKWHLPPWICGIAINGSLRNASCAPTRANETISTSTASSTISSPTEHWFVRRSPRS